MQFNNKNIEQIRITVLVEDTKNENLASAHGLSLYIETPENKILFDMGPDELFWKNAEYLGIDLNTVDTAVISHGHYDHGGGLSAFLNNNKNGKIYIRENAFGDYYSTSRGEARYIGLDKQLKTNDRLILTDPGITQISSNLILFSNVESKELCPNSNSVLWKKTENGLVNDNFEHEQNLIIKSGNRFILVGGCAHNGIINIEKKAREIMGFAPDFTISGFHMSIPGSNQSEKPGFVQKAADRLRESKTIRYTCHCTGNASYEILKQVLGDKLKRLTPGCQIIL